MTFLSYLLSIVIFFLSQIIVTTILLSAYTLFVGLIQKKISGYSNANTHSVNQFSSSLVGVLISVYFALYSFNWFDTNPNLYIILPIYGIIWLFSNLNIDTIFKPRSQRLGAGFAFFLAYILF